MKTVLNFWAKEWGAMHIYQEKVQGSSKFNTLWPAKDYKCKGLNHDLYLQLQTFNI